MTTTDHLQRIRVKCVELLRNSDKQLTPCPFCGSDKIEVIYDDGYSVGCKDCSTYIAPFLGSDADNKQKHINFWNTRICAGSAEAGWRSTIAAIDAYTQFKEEEIPWMIEEAINTIIAAWPEELL